MTHETETNASKIGNCFSGELFGITASGIVDLWWYSVELTLMGKVHFGEGGYFYFV